MEEEEGEKWIKREKRRDLEQWVNGLKGGSKRVKNQKSGKMGKARNQSKERDLRKN